jgi:FHA domain-containing protein
MLTLIVTRQDDRAFDADLRGKFGLLGGTIGAMEGNTIVLPNADGRIAPLEANVMAGSRGYVIRNCGSNPLHVNGKPVANSAEAALGPGDEVTIGPFVLRVAPADPPSPAVAATAQPAAATAQSAGKTDATAKAPVNGPAAPAATASSLAADPTQDELQRAFVEGLGLPNLEIPGGLTPEFMATLGELLRQVTQGTIDLLRIRAEAKSRVHADLTMIGSREINPLKAAWDAEVALQHLLAPQRSDMLDPLRAMTDACDDLRLHDRGLVAGIHAALQGLLARFNPAQLEKMLAAGNRFDNLLPGSGKSRRWDMLVELYGDISVEAEQDFWSIFEKEFLQAYEKGREAAKSARVGS